MSKRDPIDMAALERLKRLGGERLAVRMIDLCLETGPRRVRAAQAGELQGDWEAVGRAAHSLKSSAGNVGALAVQELAQRLELHAAARELPEARVLLAELVRAWSDAEAWLRRKREESTVRDPSSW